MASVGDVSSEVGLTRSIGLLVTVTAAGGSCAGGKGTASGGRGAGIPNGGKKGTTGYDGRGVFQSALRKLNGGRASRGAARRSGGGAGVIGGGLLNMPGGKMGTGRAKSPTGGGKGTGPGCKCACRPAGR